VFSNFRKNSWAVGLFLLSVAPGSSSQVQVLNSTGSETVTSENAERLGFTVELTNVRLEQFGLADEESNVRDPIRVVVHVPNILHNGFEFAYVSVQAYSGGSPIFNVRPDILSEISSGSKYFLFVAPANVFPCLTVSATYLNPESRMHSDYYMTIDLRSFVSNPMESCAVTYDGATESQR
jgi:hypothetical protein